MVANNGIFVALSIILTNDHVYPVICTTETEMRETYSVGPP